MSAATVYNYQFEFVPKLIKFLGEELIHDKKIAIAELVKNAYDADASEVVLNIEDNKITIEDDGSGMDADVIKEYWLKPGNSKKSVSRSRSPKYKRLPIGEKGIGRLGVHKLGNKIKVISKMAGGKETVFEVDWRSLEEKTELKDIQPVKVKESETARYFHNKTGTRLIIEELKEDFTSKDISNLHSDLLKMLPPFQHDIRSNFRINLNVKDGLFVEESELDVKQVIDKALFYYRVTIESGDIKAFTYKFYSPDEQKIASRHLELTDIQQGLASIKEKHRKQYKDEQSLVKPINVGTVIFQGYIFDAKFSKFFDVSYNKAMNDYLKDNGGIRVYRDGMRIYNYGEGGKDNDILNLDRKRAKRLGDNIGYNQLLASIELDRASSSSLIEKTNREGFIHNGAFLSLQRDLDFCMEVVLYYRRIDRANMEPLSGKEYDKADVETKVKKIVSQVDKLDIEEYEKNTLRQNLYKFSEEFAQLKDIFLTAANTGLNMTIIIHEIDKIIDHLERQITDKNLSQIERVFTHLKDTIHTYKDTIRLDKMKARLSVADIVDQTIFNMKYRLECHQVECLQEIDNSLHLIGKKGLIIGVFTNLFDNAIYWLDFYKIEKKKILIRAYEENDYIVLLLADNGKGFNISFASALSPFISGRVEESSMGIGLHLSEQVMLAHKGSIEHGDWQEDDLPEDFAVGAIIKLKFQKGD